MNRTEPIRDLELLRAFLNYYKGIGQYRNHVLLNIGVYTALRISDILQISTNAVYDFNKRKVKDYITIIEMKTNKTKTIALHQNIKNALYTYFDEVCPHCPLILNEVTGTSISRSHAYRIIDEAARAVHIPHKVSCHSLRRTFGYHAWQSGISPVVLMDIYNHSSYDITKRYLGVTQDDHNKVYLNLHV